jgi:hypothetical protein
MARDSPGDGAFDAAAKLIRWVGEHNIKQDLELIREADGRIRKARPFLAEGLRVVRMIARYSWCDTVFSSRTGFVLSADLGNVGAAVKRLRLTPAADVDRVARMINEWNLALHNRAAAISPDGTVRPSHPWQTRPSPFGYREDPDATPGRAVVNWALQWEHFRLFVRSLSEETNECPTPPPAPPTTASASSACPPTTTTS